MKNDSIYDSCMYFTATRLSRIVTEMAEEAFMPSGLSPSHAFLMMTICSFPEITPTELGQKMHLAPSTVTRLADKLEIKGYIERKSNGRNSNIRATEPGMKIQGALDMVTLGMGKTHYSNKGITTNREFSINIPSEDMVIETDYTGMVSGSKTDKNDIFKIFRGTLKHAPMIEKAPVTMECKLVDHYDYRTHDLFVGRVEKIYAEENILTGGTIDIAKVRPMLFDMHQRKYWKVGEPFADAWSVGKNYSK